MGPPSSAVQSIGRQFALEHLPSFEVVHLETPSPLTPGGVKGMGEGGTIGAPATIANAVADAVRHLGVNDIRMPCTPERVFRAIQSGGGGGAPDRAQPHFDADAENQDSLPPEGEAR